MTSAEAGEAPRDRVLVVDDQPDIRELAELVLRGEGFDVATAADGNEALELAFETRFDLILLDVNMPGMDGWETLRLLKTDEALASVPVAMFTIRSELYNQVQGIQLGATDYILKPFAADDLVAKVRGLISAGAAAAVEDDPTPADGGSSGPGEVPREPAP